LIISDSDVEDEYVRANFNDLRDREIESQSEYYRSEFNYEDKQLMDNLGFFFEREPINNEIHIQINIMV